MEVMSSTSSLSSILSSTPWNTCGVGQSVTFRSAPMGSSPLQRVWCQLLLTHVPWSPSDTSFVVQNVISMSTHLGQQDLQLNMLLRNISHTGVSHSGTSMQWRRSAWPKPLHFRGSPRDLHGRPWGFFGPPIPVPQKNCTRTLGHGKLQAQARGSLGFPCT